jgi:8-oxo-dGTP pyrophosphatase MutT (NUDIX family)
MEKDGLMRERQSARWLVLNPDRALLLFHFRHHDDALAGRSYWATPGGGVESGESFEAAAIRELWEETGLRIEHAGASVGERSFPMLLPSGEKVRSVERYYLLQVSDARLSREQWTVEEQRVMADHRWWSRAELEATHDTVYPLGLLEMLEQAGAF